MHIAILSTSYPLKRGASSGIFVSRLVDALPDTLDKTVITPCPDFPVQPKIHTGVNMKCFRYAPRRWQRLAHGPGGIPVALRRQRWLALLLPLLILSMLLSCIRIARRTDLIHANWSLNGLTAGIAGKLTATPVITTLRGSDVSRLEHSFISRLLLHGCLRTNCRVVAVNNAIKDAVCSLYPRYSTRVVTIPNGVDDTFLAISTGKNRKPGATRITSIGNLNPNKRMHTILEALPLLRNNPGISLCIVGDGPELGRLQSLAADIANDTIRIDLTGSKDPDEIPSVLADTDIFVLASYAEGRPNVVLEAMASGRPILASDIDGVRELITHEETGLLFTVDDPASLAMQLDRLLNDQDLREKIGQAARHFITTNQLNWARCAESYQGLYQTCLQGSAAA